jgi:hypothetical protein
LVAVKLTSMSYAQVMKSMNCISAMGRIPISAAPEAAPVMAISEIGVSITRSGPKRSISPLLVPNAPP